ncbi:ADP-ribosyltransferase domain-containing protein [Massilia sp. GCM10023247]|uniref:ADP-ribosyltransferase domain-containing protein n=1 Tax=Massilia sp. GCM10023247 TaxID=3252643 RepID=UPI0036116309
MRDRLSKSSVSEVAPLTFSEDLSFWECENFVLETAVTKHNFAYWAAHVLYLPLYFDKSKDHYSAQNDFPRVKDLILHGLKSHGFDIQHDEISACKSEAEMNKTIIQQYTAASDLYSRVNELLRMGNLGKDVGDDPLVPWILHLNAILRKEEEHHGVVYRGSNMSRSDIDKYVVGEQFVWSSFTSLSMNRLNCINGNVLFTITPKSSLSTYGKRAARIISHYSYFPEEEEALLPIGCAFRVEGKRKVAGNKFEIDLALYDHL